VLADVGGRRGKGAAYGDLDVRATSSESRAQAIVAVAAVKPQAPVGATVTVADRSDRQHRVVDRHRLGAEGPVLSTSIR
jgi:hypothetical protein